MGKEQAAHKLYIYICINYTKEKLNIVESNIKKNISMTIKY